MRWLVLLPAWVFLLVYAIHRVREANREAQASAPREAMAVPHREPEMVRRPRSPVLSAAELGDRTSQLRRRVQLLPVDPNRAAISPLWPPGELEGPAFELADRAGFESWRLHAGDGFAFYHPEDTGFSLEITDGPAPPRMIGASFHATDRPVDRWYRLSGPGGVTWCALAVDSGDRFDETERYPEPVSLHKLMLVPGGLARFSLLDDGALCRAQWIGDGIRVTLLDWQHGAAHRDAYAAVAASVELDGSLEDAHRRLAELVADARFATRLGLLERGMGEKAVHDILGPPVGIDGAKHLYHVPGGNGDSYFRVPIRAGRFGGFGADWRDSRRDPPIAGSIAWMREKTEIRVGESGGVGYDIGVLTDEEVEEIFAGMRDRLPKAGASDWAELCRILASMSEMGLHDASVLEILRARLDERRPPVTAAVLASIAAMGLHEDAIARIRQFFVSGEGLPMDAAILVLSESGAEGTEELFARRARALLARLRDEQAATRGVESALRELRLLMRQGDPQILRAAAAHPRDAVRETAFALWHRMPDEAVASLVGAGLRDPSVAVRRRCAEAFAERIAQPQHRELLAARLAEEADPQVREHLAEALAGLEAK